MARTWSALAENVVSGVDGVYEKAYILCLNGKTMEELGRAEADFAIGQGFHGIHLPAA